MGEIVRLRNALASCSRSRLQQSMYQFTTTEHVAVYSMCVQPSQLLKEQAIAEHVAFFATAEHVGSMCVK